jgi:hypothetical protein
MLFVTNGAWLVGAGAALAGIGSLLSGVAALQIARRGKENDAKESDPTDGERTDPGGE